MWLWPAEITGMKAEAEAAVAERFQARAARPRQDLFSASDSQAPCTLRAHGTAAAAAARHTRGIGSRRSSLHAFILFDS
jgi:hypothetical protein